jgi:hypothetical protein
MDPQQKRVYRWEDSFRSFIERTTTRHELKGLIRKACRLYGIPTPVIKFRTKYERCGYITSEYDPETHKIVLGWNDTNHAIALHETAHAIADTLYGPFLCPHGDKWLGIYLRLLEWAKIAPRSALHASAREKGLKWSRVHARRASRKVK